MDARGRKASNRGNGQDCSIYFKGIARSLMNISHARVVAGVFYM
jgi:hypothetical protein